MSNEVYHSVSRRGGQECQLAVNIKLHDMSVYIGVCTWDVDDVMVMT